MKTTRARCMQLLTSWALIGALIGLLSPSPVPVLGGAELSAKPKKKRKRSEYDRRRRQAAALIKEGHPTVELAVRTEPRVAARVYHGKELLGTAPFTIKWPKDTGSLDLVFKASGYLTVNTRLYTYRDDKVTVEMFKETEAHKLFGYRKKVKAKVNDDQEGE